MIMFRFSETYFRVTCSTQTSIDDLTSNITCIETTDSDKIERYEYSINGGVILTGMMDVKFS